MTQNQRINLTVNLLGHEEHRTTLLPTITLSELIQEILVEFGPDLPFLDQHNVGAYRLRYQGSEQFLEPALSIQRIDHGQVLVFEEETVDIPEGARRLEKPFYLRYRSHVFKIAWQPAIIGRPEPESPLNNFLTVNLEPYTLAVSRQQAELLEENDRYYIRRLSANPTLLDGNEMPFDKEEPQNSPKVPLQPDSIIHLPYSGILLACISSSKISGKSG